MSQPESSGVPQRSPDPAIGASTRRAARACTTCHSRKTRCDVLQVGVPCTKCVENEFQCSIEPRKKRRRKAEIKDSDSLAMPRVAFPEHIIRHQIPHYKFFQNLTPVGKSSLRSGNGERLMSLPIVPRDESAELHGNHRRVGPEELRFLKEMHVLDLPPKPVLDECVASYFRVFHSFFPVIDRPSFLARYHRKGSDNPDDPDAPSILIIQAIIFTACAFVPMECITKLGFSTRQQARSCFYTRTRYLHVFNYESDDIVTIQALLLISQYYHSMTEQRHTWFWAHQAISLAQGAGLHRDSGHAPQRKLWARIWWACLIRDRLITLGTNRPMHINSLDCNVPILTPADLEEEDDTEIDNLTKAIFVDFTKLCHYMEGVLSLAFAPQDTLKDQITVCETTLHNWKANLSAPSRRDADGTVQMTHGSIALVYRTFLHLIYNIVLTALLQSKSTLSRDPSSRSPSMDVVSVAADSAVLAEESTRFGLVEYFPTPSVTAIMPPLTVQVLLMRYSSNAAEVAEAKIRFSTCMEALHRLSYIYWHAGFYHDLFLLAASSGGAASSISTLRHQSNHPSQPEQPPQPIQIQAMPTSIPTQTRQETSGPRSISLLSDRSIESDASRVPEPPIFAKTSIAALLDSSVSRPTQSTDLENLPDAIDLDSDGVKSLNSQEQIRMFEEWLNDNALFSTLFPTM
ncbi:hypothetical protein BU24DRAFT_490994 [Aaosphaeria arxii CBS 175.79]|uniref:Zn(2)-C6 fungal-type domain-containing protein n=1 Tax=Aaosphaeria arxii CBS 175.79 TaxID=1450172 RepID=A0A6A5XZ60_9PLEO|nr:uncharacterized protein BU24DRAFT_490994 [Aaosphaeria arxii CBS 175.79]KAF2017920.1 hypothetical protein BU24DRAFT_490994 [Aaosphaeria arxii CBS 175.79]